MRLEPCLSPELGLVQPSCPGIDALLASVAALGARARGYPPATALLTELKDREARYPTSTPEGAAFPHALLRGIERTVVVPALIVTGVPWRNPAHPPQRLVFAMFGSIDRPWEHVRTLARLARIVRTPGAMDRILAAADPRALHDALLSEDRAHG